ncbi:nuclear receptor coactivator 4-like [Liolophura sinensis]|uniref:nuclear receptor coactivator 4-like n=1 Tax=Liolophura sinensis TaxID=3198878 RepID=UPI0031598238
MASGMITTDVPETVSKELMVNICRLESAIEQLNQVRKDLQKNSHQVKCQIQSTVSRELEALRSREVWLLSQVDLLQNVKEEILSGQQAQINQALGSAHRVLQYVTSDNTQLMEELTRNMTRLELTDLEPEESSQISFQADAAGLRDTIMEFGRVEAGNKALQKVFADTYTPSASLPKSFEEYDDADHHVLYKTLEEVNRGKSSSSSIRVNIPKLKPEDWLIQPAQSSAGVTEKKPAKIAFPTLSNNISDWLLSGNGGSECGKGPAQKSKPPLTRDKSIQDWLLQIKHFPHTHDEEDDFEIVEHVTISDASDSGMDAPSSCSTPAVVTPGISPVHFTQVTPDTLSAWLCGGVAAPSSCHLDDHNELFHGFKHCASDTEGWLLNKGICSLRCSQSPTEPVEIESLGSLVCASDRNIFTHQSDDHKRWLLQDICRVPPVTQVCKANEPCQGHGHCLSSPSCGEEFLVSTHPEQVWLINTGVHADNKQPAFSPIRNASRNMSDWLASNQSVDCTGNIDKSAFTSWFATASNNYTDWLATNESVETDVTATEPDKVFSSDELDFWLMKLQITDSHISAAPVSFSTFEAFHKNLSPASWLLYFDENLENSKVDIEEFELEKKDLVSEKTEMSKWLLNGGNLNLEPTCSPKVNPIPDLGEWLMDQNVC